jgi:hypothetical protein
MSIKKYCITLILLLFGVGIAHSQERHTEICIDFRVNSTVIDSAYSDNAARMQEMVEFLRTIHQDSTINIIEVSFCGAASPEGSYQLNRKLAQGRLSALEKFIRSEVDIPDSLITYNDSYIPWDYLKSQIEDSGLIRKDEVIAILEEEARLVDYHHPNTHIDNRVVKLRALEGGKVWQQMNNLFFDRMSNACAVFVTYKKELPPVQVPIIVPDTIKVEPIVEAVEIVPDTTAIIETVIPEVEEWNRKLYLKTNALFWGMGMTNVSAEIDLAKHWSFALPVTYSAWNYFTSTVKFRTLAVQPEFRYWFNEDNQKFFIGAHFGYAQYVNVAVDGNYRYQDHEGKSPALGCGISVGYRMPISKSDKWDIEFSLGAGVYSLHYDKFYNTPNTKDGLMIESVKKTYWGIDQAAVSFSYSFDLKKKGGKR